MESESDCESGEARLPRWKCPAAGQHWVTGVLGFALAVYFVIARIGREQGAKREALDPARAVSLSSSVACSSGSTAVSSAVSESSFAPEPRGTCNSFQEKTDNCAGDWQGKKCGACFNPGARAGAKCKGAHPGYSCPPDKPDSGGDMAFACMDWSFGSTGMMAAEASYNCRSGTAPVFFGVGTYGVDQGQDPMGGLGQCVQLHVLGLDREIIAQSINTGHDVSVNQFDLQMGAGGTGLFNTCAGDVSSMFPGPKNVWGHQFGGLENRSQCSRLPKYPRDGAPMRAAGDSLIALCEYAFDKGVYSNPSIASITRVACPAELVNLTQFRRSDEPSEAETSRRLAGRPKAAEGRCRSGVPGAGNDYCLTRMMDCRKPSGAIKDNLQQVQLLAQGHRLVQPCLADGYTRIDVQCGCHDCYC
mmetsp:Transcript_4978/g.11685  ORF Transcript_4978/g.11685 Transcript_4978/m.11685 type:complete len:417 (-) Transcript_4978:65-1315(-)